MEDDSQKVRALVLPGDKSAEYLPEGIEVTRNNRFDSGKAYREFV